MKVIARLQAEKQTPVMTTWANDTDEVGAMLSVAQLLEHARNDEPWAPRVLEIRIEL